MTKARTLRTALIVALSAAPLFADFSYDQTSQITGGALLQMMHFAGAFSKSGRKLTEPMQSTTSIKGNRLIRKGADQATIIDLDQQTITTIHNAEKTYSVMTFEQLKQQMAEASEKMHSRDGNQANLSFDVNVKDTGQTKTINGQNTHEMVMTLTAAGSDAKSGTRGGMNVVNDSWIAPGVAGYSEVRDFHKRMADALGWVPGENPLINRPDLAKGIAELYKQGAKLDGMPLLTLVKMGAAVEGSPDSSANQAEPAQENQHSEAPPTSIGGALGSALGSRFGRHKKQNDAGAPDSSASGSNSGQSSGSLLEMKTEVTGYNSNSVDASLFEVPAGFSKVTENLTGRRHP